MINVTITITPSLSTSFHYLRRGTCKRWRRESSRSTTAAHMVFSYRSYKGGRKMSQLCFGSRSQFILCCSNCLHNTPKSEKTMQLHMENRHQRLTPALRFTPKPVGPQRQVPSSSSTDEETECQKKGNTARWRW